MLKNKKVIFEGADLRGVSFKNARLNQADFSEAKMLQCNFYKSDLSFSDMSTAVVRRVRHNVHINNTYRDSYQDLIRRLHSAETVEDLSRLKREHPYNSRY